MLLHRVIALIAAVLCLGGAPMRALAALADDMIAHCCCGPHDADDDCGCPHCPAAGGAHADADRDQPADGVPRIGPCRLQGERAALVVFDLVITAPAATMPVADPPGRADFPTPPRLVIGSKARPPSPPPRRVT